jgi:hypothetical protein
MAVTINASTSAGLVQTADLSGSLQIQTAGTTAVTVNSSQNVGIGTTSPVYKLEVLSATNTGIAVGDGTYQGSFVPSSLGGIAITTNGAYPLISYVNGAERMRIDANGNLLVNCTSLFSGLGAKIQSTTQAGYWSMALKDTASNGSMIVFVNPIIP